MATGDSDLPGNVIVDVLSQCREMIVTNLSSLNSVMDHIITKGVFTDVEVHDIMDLKRTSDKVNELIILVKKTGSKGYDAFLSALSSTKQEHLLGKIEEEESKVLKDMEHAPVEESPPICQAPFLISRLYSNGENEASYKIMNDNV